MARRRVSRVVGMRELRGLDGWVFCCCCCWVVLGVVGGGVGCLGMLPLRLVGVDEEAIGGVLDGVKMFS